MKVIHTSDWHLGQKFLTKDRIEEHQKALDWLIDIVRQEHADVMLISGDIFDNNNPPNYARNMFYQFLHQMQSTSCRHIVITGGNHDSPSMLNAPKDILRYLQVHIVGEATENPEDELIPLYNEQGELIAVVAAIPFLRDSNLRNTFVGQLVEERSNQIRQGIIRHYELMADTCAPFIASGVPILAMGHLYATGAQSSDKQDNIYVGNIENIEAGQFPKVFDYIALGHIHRHQAIGGLEHIRYCGSLIPLSFSETRDQKGVYSINFEGRTITDINFHEAPLFRRLKTIRGSQEAIEQAVKAFAERHQDELKPWLDIIVEVDAPVPLLDQTLRDNLRDLPIEILKVRLAYPGNPHQLTDDDTRLPDLRPMDVFLKKCETLTLTPEQLEQLTATFLELLEWQQQKETNL